jgi:DMSO reductase anchor subunit
MTKLTDKIKNGLNEGLILIIGAEVLLGFQYRSVFESGFEKLPPSSQYLKLVGLGLLLSAIALFMLPAAYHRIVDEGEDTEALNHFTSMVMSLALLPFGVGLAIDFYIQTEKVLGASFAIIVGGAALLVALFFWYGLEFIGRARRMDEGSEGRMPGKNQSQRKEATKLEDKVEHVLNEARIVLPGAQALLGFQFATILVEGFDKLPDTLKYIHLMSLGLIALATILLMTPAAYHRIVEEGEPTEHFHRTASRLILVAMVPLALGIAGDLYVVVNKVLKSDAAALVSALVMLIFFYGLWFGYTFYRRQQELRPQAALTARRSK